MKQKLHPHAALHFVSLAYMNQKQLGDLGEKVAIEYLKNKDYQILDKNYSTKFISGPKKGEIDIIAKKDEIISFVEVKTLTSNKIILPEEKIDYQKQRKIIKTAKNWLMEKNLPLDIKWQIDVVSITLDLNIKLAKIRHFKNVTIDS